MPVPVINLFYIPVIINDYVSWFHSLRLPRPVAPVIHDTFCQWLHLVAWKMLWRYTCMCSDSLWLLGVTFATWAKPASKTKARLVRLSSCTGGYWRMEHTEKDRRRQPSRICCMQLTAEQTNIYKGTGWLFPYLELQNAREVVHFDAVSKKNRSALHSSWGPWGRTFQKFSGTKTSLSTEREEDTSESRISREQNAEKKNKKKMPASGEETSHKVVIRHHSGGIHKIDCKSMNIGYRNLQPMHQSSSHAVRPFPFCRYIGNGSCKRMIKKMFSPSFWKKWDWESANQISAAPSAVLE